MAKQQFISVCAALGLAIAVLPTVVFAAVITTPVGDFLPFYGVNYSGVGPQTVTDGVTWTSDWMGSVYGWDQGYGFVDNGFSEGVPLAGLNSNSDRLGFVTTMSFVFDTPVSAVGAVLNWIPSEAPVTISSYDAAGHLLDSLTVSAGGGNLVPFNVFYGFQETSAVISRFSLSDGYIAAIGGLTVDPPQPPPPPPPPPPTAVPEPEAWMLAIAGYGLAGLGLRRYRRGARGLSASLA